MLEKRFQSRRSERRTRKGEIRVSEPASPSSYGHEGSVFQASNLPFVRRFSATRKRRGSAFVGSRCDASKETKARRPDLFLRPSSRSSLPLPLHLLCSFLPQVVPRGRSGGKGALWRRAIEGWKGAGCEGRPSQIGRIGTFARLARSPVANFSST